MIPTYPSSGSEFGLGAVSTDERTNEFGTAYGIAADVALLVPRYSMSLDAEMTAYTGLVTLVQLSAATIEDRNPVSYEMGISVISNVLKATKTVQENPNNADARGTILYGAALSTSGWLGLGKEENYPYEIYEIEFIPEVLFGSTYRKSLTTLFPRFLEVMAQYHLDDIQAYYQDVFNFEGEISESTKRLVDIFSNFGIDMYFDGKDSSHSIDEIPIETTLKPEDLKTIISKAMRS